MSGPVMADAWVRVVPGDQIPVGQQADRIVAGAGVLPLLSFLDRDSNLLCYCAEIIGFEIYTAAK